VDYSRDVAILTGTGVKTCALMLVAVSVMTAETSNIPDKKGCIRKTFGKFVYVRIGASVLFDQIRNHPREWDRGAAGLGKRAASSFSRHALSTGIRYGVAYIRDEQLGYTPSEKQGFWPRTKYALVSTVVTRKVHTGQRTVAAGRISGVFGSAMISRLWMPARLRTVGSGVSSAGISMGIDAGLNMVREFWPEIRRRKRVTPTYMQPAHPPTTTVPD
jgi:hypothetical protein